MLTTVNPKPGSMARPLASVRTNDSLVQSLVRRKVNEAGGVDPDSIIDELVEENSRLQSALSGRRFARANEIRMKLQLQQARAWSVK